MSVTNYKNRNEKPREMIVSPPKTIEDFEKVLASILELQKNPHCDHKMYLGLIKKETEARTQIALLNDIKNQKK